MVRVAIALVVMLLLPSAAWAQAEKRIALLIGNQGYASEIGRLANPHNDVALLEKSLKALGFEVAVERDASLGALTRAVNAYARRVQAAGPNAVGFFYYSGHGAADAGTNYLIPVDVKTTETGELWDQSLRLTSITRQLKTEAGNATHFVVFDACRNTLKLTKTGSRSLVQSKGFVPVTQETGMLIAYATAEGELASDIGAGAGPYARVLAEEIVKPGIEAVTMFRRVQVRVRSTIGQEPWLGFSAIGEVHLAGLQVDLPKPPSAPIAPQVSEAERTWPWVKDSTNEGVLETFIKQFGDTPFGGMASARLENLRKQNVAIAEPPKIQPAPSGSYTVTIPAGLTSHQIVERLRADTNLSGEIAKVPGEGSMLPETLVVEDGASRQLIIDRMAVEARKFAERAWAQRNKGLPLKSLEEAIVLASIVEKETGRGDQLGRVAAVFVNRLRNNMRLQSDPTILYGLMIGEVVWNRPILRSEITQKTTYNTYQIDGLPPTPICNPSRAAIEAVLSPAHTKDLYFVSDGVGGHVFAETLKEHNSNVARWRAGQK